MGKNIGLTVLIVLVVVLIGFNIILIYNGFNQPEPELTMEEYVPPMVFESIGRIGHGVLTNTSEVLFKFSDIKRAPNGYYTANVHVPIKFQRDTRDVYMHMNCVNKDTRHTVFKSMEDKSTHYYFRSYEGYEEYLSGKVSVYNDEGIVTNTGYDGTRIIFAEEGSEADFLLQFSLSDLNTSTIECRIGVISGDPPQSIQVPLDIVYIRD